jgi:hypothetical protein
VIIFGIWNINKMELHKTITIDKSKYKFSLNDHYLDYFSKASDFTLTYYKEDFDRIANTKFSEVSAEFFLQEMSWAISVSGFNARIVSGFFPKMMKILEPMFSDISKQNWKNWDDLVYVEPELMEIFGNTRKVKSIIFNSISLVGQGIKDLGWEEYRNNNLDTPEKLQKFKMVGPVISMHLARNIGLLDFVKPDLHLVRMANTWGFSNPMEMCKSIQQKYDMPLGLIDLCLFYAASSFGSKQ